MPSSSCSASFASANCAATSSRTSAARSTGSVCSAAWPLARRSLSSSSVIRSRISPRSRSSALRCSPSSTNSALIRARVSGLRSSWLMASSSARLASSLPCRLAAMRLMRSARSPSSSLRRTGIGGSNSPRPKRATPALMSSSGRSRRRTKAKARPVSSSSAPSVIQPKVRGRASGGGPARPKRMRWPSAVVRARPQPSLPKSCSLLLSSLLLFQRLCAAGVGVRVVVQLRPVDADRHRQARGDGAGARLAGRRADFCRELVHVVGHQRLGVALPAALQHALHAEQERRAVVASASSRNSVTRRHLSEWRQRWRALRQCPQRSALSGFTPAPRRRCSRRCAGCGCSPAARACGAGG